MTLDSWSSCAAKNLHCADNSMIMFYTGGSTRYSLVIGMPLNRIDAFNADFECPTHCVAMFELKYLPCSSLEDFLPLQLESFFVMFLQSLRLPLCTGVV